MANLAKSLTLPRDDYRPEWANGLTEKSFLVSLCPFDFKGFETMSGSKDYIINFGSLPFGEHEFEYQIDSAFFQQFEHSLVENGEVDVLVVLEKKESMLLIDFTMEGEVHVTCDRCLEELIVPIESFDEIIVKFSESDDNNDESENIIVLPQKSYEIDVAQFIYEFITLQVPLRNVHDLEENGQECNPEVLKEIEKHLQKEDTPPEDPRWEGLKGINLN